MGVNGDGQSGFFLCGEVIEPSDAGVELVVGDGAVEGFKEGFETLVAGGFRGGDFGEDAGEVRYQFARGLRH